ncbi:hypothetical protein XELAEV_18047094mg [Xenopus laevis]|uniref:Uncharacterized protein n=1 Tax=Xenopus laevis TaxID=8355 RepID=A0A974BV67_XENLA|nr:hypothetical protein XELAEV_18047094mg [Xenopus laevis]
MYPAPGIEDQNSPTKIYHRTQELKGLVISYFYCIEKLWPHDNTFTMPGPGHNTKLNLDENTGIRKTEIERSMSLEKRNRRCE